MADNSKIIDALRLFNTKADDVLNSSMLDELSKHGTGVAYDDDGNVEKKHGPTADHIKAFVLDFRFFIQDNERCSFRNLARLYQDAPVEAWLKKNFESARDYIQTYLDAPGSLEDKYKGDIVSNRELLDTFLYGGLAHANKNKERLFNEWMADPQFSIYVDHEFVWMLSGLCWVIKYVKGLNEEALRQLT